MAQDFHAAFGLGETDTTIATVDADGVAFFGGGAARLVSTCLPHFHLIAWLDWESNGQNGVIRERATIRLLKPLAFV